MDREVVMYWKFPTADAFISKQMYEGKIGAEQLTRGHPDNPLECGYVGVTSWDAGIPVIMGIHRGKQFVPVLGPVCAPAEPKDSGSDGTYYDVRIDHPLHPGRQPAPYTATCQDIIDALDMNFNEGNAFKALWRMAAARKGKGKAGNTRLYDAQKIAFYGNRILTREENK